MLTDLDLLIKSKEFFKKWRGLKKKKNASYCYFRSEAVWKSLGLQMQKKANALKCGLESTEQVRNTWKEACFRIQRAYSSPEKKNPNRFKMQQIEGGLF